MLHAEFNFGRNMNVFPKQTRLEASGRKNTKHHLYSLSFFYYLVLLTEVHTEDLGVAQRPFDTVEGCSGGHGLLSRGVLQR